MKISLLFLFLLITVNLSARQIQQDEFIPVNLTCEYALNPLGIDSEFPSVSWNISAKKRNWKQISYQIIVSSDSLLLSKNRGDIWDSKKVISSKNINIRYQGSPLKSSANCWWKVRVWDANGSVSKWSKPAYWKMGILLDKDWKGKWIASDIKLKDYQIKLKALPDTSSETEIAMWKRADTIRNVVHPGDSAPAAYIRKEFSINKKIKRATAFLCGIGLHELYLNGERVGDEYLNPANTDYQKRILYNTYDVTKYAKNGTNAIGIILGNGWYNPIVPHALKFYTADYIDPPKLKMQLNIEYDDGSVSVIASDNSWKYSTNGPIVYNDILSGESYDARKEMPHWNNTGFNDESWQSCVSATAPAGKLVAQHLYPIRKLAAYPAVKLEKKNNQYTFDLGKEICGWIKIKVKGTRGDKIKISYLGSGGHTLGRYQTHYYTFKGNGEEIYEPGFSYNGFRYVTVENVQGTEYTPVLSDVEGVLVASDLKAVGHFASSNEKFNKIQEILLNTVHNYITHLPNDPTREKSAWVQDIENGFDVNAYNFDVANMYIKWQHDFNDIIHEDGYVPPVVPSRFDGPGINGPWWGGMIVYNVIKLDEYYNDAEILKKSYDPMKKYMGYLTSISKDNIVEWGLGDWMEPANNGGPPTTTPVPLTSTIAYYYYATKMASFAHRLNKSDDAKYFEILAAKIKQSYNKHFFNEQTGQYAKGSQAGQLMSLKFDLVPADKRGIVIQRLRDYIAKEKGHVATGFVATPLLLTTLSDLGLSAEAYEMATKPDYPGWYDMIFNKGNSVMKENWQGGLVQMPSLAGPIGYWFYYSLAGIKPEPGKRAFKQIVINPDLLKELSWVSASYQSIQGEIASKWKIEDGKYRLDVKIPANTTAIIHLPAADVSKISEGNKNIKQQKDINIIKHLEKETLVNVGSGDYSFTVVLN